VQHWDVTCANSL